MDSVFDMNEDVKPVVTSDGILESTHNLMCDVWHRKEIKKEYFQTELDIKVKQEDVCIEPFNLPSEVPGFKCDPEDDDFSVKLESLHEELDIKAEILDNNEEKAEEGESLFKCDIKQEYISVESLKLPSEVPGLKCYAKDDDSSLKLESLDEEFDIKAEILDNNEEKAEEGESLFKCDIKQENISVESLKLPSEVPDLKCNTEEDENAAIKLELLREQIYIKTETLDPNKEKAEDGENPFECDLCDYTCKRWSSLQEHSQTHTKPFKCNLCDFQSTWKFNLTKHMKIHTGEKSFKCSLCDYKTLWKNDLKKHMLTHTSEKLFKCKLCDFKSTCKTSLHHMLTHKFVFKCSLCDFKAVRRNELRRHLKIHTDANPSNSNLCHNTFLQRNDPKHQMLTRTGEKLLECNACDYKSEKILNLKRHMRKRHTLVFKCNLCDYKSSRESELDHHTLIHIFAFKCKLCDFKCARKSELKCHMQTHTCK